MKVGLAQYDFTVYDCMRNVEKMLVIYQQACQQQLELLVFPELAITGYIPEDFLLREDFLQQTQFALEQLVAAVGPLAVVVGCPVKEHGLLYNAAILIHQQKIVKIYKKQCLPNYGVFDEPRYFTAGNESCVFQLTPDGPKFGLLICEDVWFQEPALRAQNAGAELLLTIHASPFAINKEKIRRQIYKKTCEACHLPLLATYLVGAQDELCFDGGSRFLDAKGNILLQAEFFKEQLLIVDLAKKFPIVLDEFDHQVAHVYQALVLGIRDYFKKNGFKGALLGLSGGIDSSLTLMLAIDALGVENVTAVAMPSRFTSELSMSALQQQVALTGVALTTLSIEPLFTASLSILAPEFSNYTVDKTEENLQARCRGILLMALSNKTGKIVLTTGNKSEMAMGYATLYGDMAGGFAALKDVPKTLVFALARYRNSIDYKIPEVIITRPPTAELAANQVDQDTLPPYEILDEILHRSIVLQQSVAEIVAAGFAIDLVKRIVRTLYRNEYKRRQAPPGIKITEVSFTRDRRYPITMGIKYDD